MSRTGLRVMIVEDEFLVATMIEDMLIEGGHRVVGIADDYDSAVSLADSARPDLALLDLQLIGSRTGVDVAGELGRLGIACMFATGNCPASKAKGLAVACLHKPFTEHDLLASVEAVRTLMGGGEPAAKPGTLHLL